MRGGMKKCLCLERHGHKYEIPTCIASVFYMYFFSGFKF